MLNKTEKIPKDTHKCVQKLMAIILVQARRAEQKDGGFLVSASRLKVTIKEALDTQPDCLVTHFNVWVALFEQCFRIDFSEESRQLFALIPDLERRYSEK